LTRTIPLTPTNAPASRAPARPVPLGYGISGPPRTAYGVLPRRTQIIGQRVQVGLRYAGQIVTIEVDETTLRVYDHREHLIKHVPRISRKEVRRHKAYGHTTNQKTG
jgi:hypothetical protein